MANIFWPEVDDLWGAKKACIQGSSVTLLVAIVTAVVTYLHLKGTTIIAGLNGANFIDAAVFLFLTFFIYRCSRIATLAALVLYAYGQAMLFQETHRIPTMGIFFTLFLVGAIRGAFSFHEIKKGMSAEDVKTMMKEQREAAEPQVSPAKRFIAWGVLIALALGGGGYWWYRKGPRHFDLHGIFRNMTRPAGTSAMATVAAGPEPVIASSKSQSPVASPVSSGGERVFKLKDGRTIRGHVVLDDPFYYNVATSRDRVEVVIKEDIAT